MKKVLCLVMALLLLTAGLTACGQKADKTDMEYVKEKGTLIVGITDFAPMDYQDADGNWIGFDADLAKAFAAKEKLNLFAVCVNRNAHVGALSVW